MDEDGLCSALNNLFDMFGFENGFAVENYLVTLDGNHFSCIFIHEVFHPALEYTSGELATHSLLEVGFVYLEFFGKVEDLKDFLIGFETNGTEECRHGQLLLTIDVCVHDIVDVSSKLNPRALEGNDTCGIQLCAVGMDARAKEYAGRTVQLRNDNALCTIDNKRTILGHIRDRTEENILDDGAEVLVVRVGTIKFEFGL